MTIAACYVSPEGVVLGADSTSTYGLQNGNHYYNHGQKLFEIGENSQFGIVTWGMGGLPAVSYRTLIAKLGDDLIANPPATVQDVANRWAAQFWPAYQQNPFFQLVTALSVMVPYDAANPNTPNMRSEDQEKEFAKLKQSLVAGFCVGGCSPVDRTPAAYQILFEVPAQAAPVPLQVPMLGFWGAPNFIARLLNGIDMGLRDGILASGKWSGTAQELDDVAKDHKLAIFVLPLREAADFIYSSIKTTIKALKFSSLSQICGGPIEIAVITSDRRFRWVRHKPWDSAINEGDIE